MKKLFDALDKCEELLDKQRYICGNTLSETDIRLFVTLIRFDEVVALIILRYSGVSAHFFDLNKLVLKLKKPYESHFTRARIIMSKLDDFHCHRKTREKCSIIISLRKALFLDQPKSKS